MRVSQVLEPCVHLYLTAPGGREVGFLVFYRNQNDTHTGQSALGRCWLQTLVNPDSSSLSHPSLALSPRSRLEASAETSLFLGLQGLLLRGWAAASGPPQGCLTLPPQCPVVCNLSSAQPLGQQLRSREEAGGWVREAPILSLRGQSTCSWSEMPDTHHFKE